MKRLWTIRTQLFLLLLAVATPLLALAALNIFENWNQARKEALNETLGIARLISTRIDDHVRTIDSLLHAVDIMVGADLGAVDHNDARLRTLQSRLPEYFSSISVLTAEGRMLNSSTATRQEREHLDFADRDYFREAMARPGLTLGAPAISRTSGKWIIVAAQSLRAADGSVRAIVSVSTNLERFQDMLVPTVLPPGSLMTVLDERGIVVARSVDPSKWVGTDLSASPNLKRARAVRELSDETVASDGVKRLAGYTTPRLVPWIVYVGMPSELALSEAHVQLAWLIAFAALAIAVATALSYLLARKLTRPIEAIARGAQQVAAGHLDARVELSGATEVIQVARAFNNMLETISSTQGSLREREARIRNIFEQASDGIYLISSDYRYLDVNTRGLELLGYKREELLQMTVADVLVPRERPRLAIEPVEMLAGKPHLAEWEHLRKDGSSFPAEVSARRIDDRSYIAIVRDLTERKQTEKALRESDARLRNVLDSMFPFVGLLSLDGRVLEANRTPLDAAGLAREDVIGKPCSEIWWFNYAPEVQDRLNVALARAAAGDAVRYDETIRVAGGRFITIDLMFSPLRDVEGRTSAIVGSAIDITERKRVEEVLRESEEKLRLFIEHAPSAIAMFDRDMRYVACSRRWLADYGLGDRDVTGRSHYEIFPDIPERWKTMHRRCLAGAVERSEEDPFPRADGRLDWIRWEIHPWRTKDEEVGGIILFSEVITERKLAGERIRRLNRVYSVLSSINSLIVRVRDRKELFDEVCRIAVEHGGFGIAWIGSYDPVVSEITPVAWAGADAESLATTRSVENQASERPRGALAIAVHERQPAVNNDITMNPQEGGPRRHEAVRRGYRSVIVLPLVVKSSIIGSFSLFSKEPDFFDDEEVRLLTELAGDISFALEHIAVRQQAEHLAFYDALTGLPNRSLFLEHLSHSLHSAGSNSSRLVLALGDIRRFRILNDTLGRHAGDELLKQVAGRLQQLVRNPENLARVSANCFATFLPDVRDLTEVAHRVENLMSEAVHNPISINDQDIIISLAVGISIYPQDGTDAETLYRNAEAALAKAKAAGVSYEFYEPALNASVAETLKLESKLRRALEQEHFVLFYQPKVSTRDRRITGLEALIRWKDPEMGLVPPAKFIPLMEETGLILDVGRWALGRAADDWRSWTSKGLKPPRVAVNVSAIQLRQKAFVDTIVQTLEKFDGPEIPLDLEITESMIMENVQETVKRLQIVRGLGVEVSLDDFGTGYSSLSYIARLPINSVKIDRSFIMGMAGNPQDMSIVTTIIALAHSLNLKVIAEGVESEDQAKLLMLLKCDEAQGYLFSKPVPPVEIEILLREQS